MGSFWTRRGGVLYVSLFSLLLTAAVALAEDRKPSACASLLTEAIPRPWIEKMIREGKASDPAVKRLRDVVQRLGFANAALNQDVIRDHSEKYTVELEQGPPTNQKQSGRCWIFAGLNMVRSMLIAEGKVPRSFEFSENYLHFFNMLEKSNRYLEKAIRKIHGKGGAKTAKLSKRELRSALEPQIGDGGWYEYFLFLVSKYGLVPKEAMPETRSSESTAALLVELKRQLATTAAEILNAASDEKIAEGEDVLVARAIKERGMAGIWKILATHLGDPPGEFDFRAQLGATRKGGVTTIPTMVVHTTPLLFATKFVKFDPTDYVVATGYATRETGKVFEQKRSAIGHAVEGEREFNVRFLNVPMNRLEELAVAAVTDGQPVWFAADMAKDVDHASGIMHPEIYQRDPLYSLSEDERMGRLSRQAQSFFGLTGPNHAMVLTGLDRPDLNGPVIKFKNENSWGDAVGSRGVYHLYRAWFHENVFQIIVHKKYLSEDERKVWDGEPVQVEENEELF